MIITKEGNFFYIFAETNAIYGGGMKSFDRPEGVYYIGKGNYLIDYT